MNKNTTNKNTVYIETNMQLPNMEDLIIALYSNIEYTRDLIIKIRGDPIHISVFLEKTKDVNPFDLELRSIYWHVTDDIDAHIITDADSFNQFDDILYYYLM